MLGICNGFQVLCEARPAAGRAAAQRVAAVRLPPGRRAGREHRARRSRAPAGRASVLSVPVKHTTGRYFAPAGSSTSSRPTARWCCATCPGRTRTARCATSPACPTSSGNVVRADAAPRARRRPADRLDRRRRSSSGRWLAALRRYRHDAVVPPRRPAQARALGLTEAELDRICELLGREPERARAGGLLAAVVRALRLQALEEAAAHAADRGRARR